MSLYLVYYEYYDEDCDGIIFEIKKLFNDLEMAKNYVENDCEGYLKEICPIKILDERTDKFMAFLKDKKYITISCEDVDKYQEAKFEWKHYYDEEIYISQLFNKTWYIKEMEIEQNA